MNYQKLLFTGKATNPSLTANPFSNASTTTPPRPVFHPPITKPSINEIKQQSITPFSPPGAAFTSAPILLNQPYNLNSQFSAAGSMNQESGSIPPAQDPWMPVSRSTATNANSPWVQKNESPNPFLS